MEVTSEVVLEATVEDVWAALTDPERLEEWFANDVELELEPGGEGVFRWADGEERHGGTRVLVRETLGAGWSTALARHAMTLAQRV